MGFSFLILKKYARNRSFANRNQNHSLVFRFLYSNVNYMQMSLKIRKYISMNQVIQFLNLNTWVQYTLLRNSIVIKIGYSLTACIKHFVATVLFICDAIVSSHLFVYLHMTNRLYQYMFRMAATPMKICNHSTHSSLSILMPLF